jgi:hypothetical protein
MQLKNCKTHLISEVCPHMIFRGIDLSRDWNWTWHIVVVNKIEPRRCVVKCRSCETAKILIQKQGRSHLLGSVPHISDEEFVQPVPNLVMLRSDRILQAIAAQHASCAGLRNFLEIRNEDGG